MIKINDLKFAFPSNGEVVLNIPSLHLPKGSFSLVLGPSGGGKSTFLRLTNGLVPHFTGGTVNGKIQVNGLDPIQESPHGMSKYVGFVFQEPENQFVLDIVEDEIAFTLENFAFPRNEIKDRIDSVLNELQISHLRNRKLHTLSGGEAQRVAIAAALVINPKLFVLDEPTSQLDPISAKLVMDLLIRLKKQHNLTVLLAEHRIERVLPFCDHLVLVPGGNAPTEAGATNDMLLKVNHLPPITALFRKKKLFPLPITLAEAQQRAHEIETPKPAPESTQIEKNEIILSIKELSIQNEQQSRIVDVSFELHQGERLVIMGPNGAGKSSLLRSIVGLIKPSTGQIEYYGKNLLEKTTAQISNNIGLLPQDPNALLFSDSVIEELEHTLKNHQLPIKQDITQTILAQLNLSHKQNSYPRDLSSGERQRVALGAICITQPPLLLLDEPTRGLDIGVKSALIDLLKEWNNQGMTIILVTHDVEFAAAFASRLIIMKDGKFIDDGLPSEVFNRNMDFAPQMVKLFPNSGYLTIREIL